MHPSRKSTVHFSRSLSASLAGASAGACLALVACGGHPSADASGGSLLACDAGGCEDGGDAAAPYAETPLEPATDLDASAPDGCGPEAGSDVPDDNFTDTNCDGIDGDKDAAIFVAPTGSDSASGAYGQPVQTIATAVRLAIAAGKSVYACNATYPEAIAITSAVSIYGGYDCANGWQRIDDDFTLAPASGMALTVTGVTAPMTVDHAQLTSPDAGTPGGSSIASLVSNSTAVTFQYVVFQSGAGGVGTDGTSPAANMTAASSGNSGATLPSLCAIGQTQSCTSGGAGGGFGESCTNTTPTACEANTSGGVDSPAGSSSCQTPGGPGGDGLNSNGTEPQAPAQQADGGIVPNDDSDGGAFDGGAPGSAGAIGAVGAGADSGVGTFTASDYEPSNVGGVGAVGASGVGGNGGRGESIYIESQESYQEIDGEQAGGGGGAGGYGGCGGAGGSGGTGGGASIGLLAFDSGITLVACALDTGSGGTGGNGAPGAAGQPGGAGGAGALGVMNGVATTLGQGLAGGVGGAGGPGGTGGGGGGGPSIGVVCIGATPSITATVFNIGAGGVGGQTSVGPGGAAGLSASVYPPLASDAGAAGDDADIDAAADQ